MLRQPQPQDQARILEQTFADHGIKVAHRQALDVVARLHGHKNWHLMSKALAEPVPTTSLPSWAQQVNPEREITLIWCVEDVFSVRPDLAASEAMMVLQEVHRRHDASHGVTWDTLTDEAGRLFDPWIADALLYPEGGGAPVPVAVKLHTGAVYEGVSASQVRADHGMSPDAVRGTLEFKALPGERFEVDCELCNSDSDALHDICEALRAKSLCP